MNYTIKDNCSNKTYLINELEIKFFQLLYNTLPININNNISLTRMSNGTINVEYKRCQVGRIKLQGRKHFMQILTSIYNHKIVYDNFENYIDEWIKYIKKYLL